MPADIVAQAIEKIRAGQAAEARRLLMQALKENPRQESAWLWLVQTLPDDAQRIAALEQCLRFNPQSEKARQGLSLLRGRLGGPARPPAPAAPGAALPPVPHFSMAEKPAPPPAPAAPNPPPFLPGTEDLPPLNRGPLPAETAGQGGLNLGGLFQRKLAGAGQEEGYSAEESDLGLEISEREPAPLPPPLPVAEETQAETAAEPAPAAPPQAPAGDEAALAALRREGKGSRAQRLFRALVRVISISFIGTVLILGGLFAWARYGQDAQERVQQVLVPPTPTVTPTVPTPTITPTPLPTATVTPTPTPPPPTETPIHVAGARPEPGMGQIVFSSNRAGDLFGLFVVPDDGDQATLLVNSTGSNLLNPGWSPDGARLVYVQAQSGSDVSDIYVINANGADPLKLTQDGKTNQQPAWSPDGKQIAYVSLRDGNPQIYLMNADGSNDRRFTHDTGQDTFPAWSPSGNLLVFVSDRDGGSDLYTMTADGSVVTRLTHGEKEARSPAWSPDGQWIAYSSTKEGDREIYLVSPDGKKVMRLTSMPGNDDEPAWSPDSLWLAFTSERLTPGKPVLYLIHADGTGAYRVSFRNGIDHSPSWSRTGP